jgi:hypothetical protein
MNEKRKRTQCIKQRAKKERFSGLSIPIKTPQGIGYSILGYSALLAFVVFIYPYLIDWQFSIYFLGLYLLPIGFFMFSHVFSYLNDKLSTLALIWRSLGCFILITRRLLCLSY